MKGKTKAALFGAGAMLSAAAIRGGLDIAITHNLVGEALDREEPKSVLRMKGRIPMIEDPPEWIQLRQTLENAPHDVVQMQSFDGTLLIGHLFRAENPQRVVLAMHGWRSSWARDFGLISPFLWENGCTVLYAEQRGQGNSGGDYMGFGMIERFDCLEWARWLFGNGFSQLPMYLAGISMGAATVLMSSGFPDLPENVSGIIADCGFTSAGAVWRHVSEDNLHISYRPHRRRADGLCRRRIELGTEDYSTLDAMAVNKTPVLFIHGEEDTFVPPEMTRQNYEACQAPKRLFLVPGAAHAMSYVKDQEGYERAVKEFWQMCENRGKT